MQPEENGAVYSNLIIGGTIKAATSSVFTYLSAHPQVCGSSVKETFFFTHSYTGNVESDLKKYDKYFNPQSGNKIKLEASPNYLGYLENVAPRIKSLLPDVQLLFILRNPVERLYSYFNFAKAKLEIPEDLSFEKFVDLCMKYAARELSPKQAGIAEKHLRALEIGNYSQFLRNYFEVFPKENIKVMLMEGLNKDPVGFMQDICGFVGIEPEFYRSYTFERVNVTFSGKIKIIHYIAMRMNKILESILRQRPQLKMALVKFYKRFNQRREGYGAMSGEVRQQLVEYYSKCNAELAGFLEGTELPPWIAQTAE